MKKVLITGSNGFVGQNICASLNNEYEIIGVATKRNNESYQFFECDITNYELMEEIIKDVKPQIIIHLAAIVHKNNNDTSERNYMLINYEATKMLADLSNKYQVEKFIFASTIEVYGENDELIINEQTPIKPLSYYAQSKALAEAYLLDNNFSFKTYILRFCPLYGSGFTLNIDKRIFLKKDKIAYYFKKGDYSFSFCSINNICSFIKDICNTNINSGIYLLSDKENYQAQSLIRLYQDKGYKIFKIKIPYYLTSIALSLMEQVIKLFKKKDVYFSARNFNKLFLSKRYDSSKANTVSHNLNDNFSKVLMSKDKGD
ncbi:MAG: NAD-dependent epimerase/dehydratase family protein [Bacilli bacterium]